MTDLISEGQLRCLVFQGYQQRNAKQPIAAEVADSRVAFANARTAPADICLCHVSVAGDLPSDDGFLVLGRRYIAENVWYLGIKESAL